MEPLRQLLELAHHPHPARIAHAEQVVEVAQGSLVVLPDAQTPDELQVSPAQQSDEVRHRCVLVRHAQWPLMQSV